MWRSRRPTRCPRRRRVGERRSSHELRIGWRPVGVGSIGAALVMRGAQRPACRENPGHSSDGTAHRPCRSGTSRYRERRVQAGQDVALPVETDQLDIDAVAAVVGHLDHTEVAATGERALAVRATFHAARCCRERRPGEREPSSPPYPLFVPSSMATMWASPATMTTLVDRLLVEELADLSPFGAVSASSDRRPLGRTDPRGRTDETVRA